MLLAETTYNPHMVISSGVTASNLDMTFLVSRDFHKFNWQLFLQAVHMRVNMRVGMNAFKGCGRRNVQQP